MQQCVTGLEESLGMELVHRSDSGWHFSWCLQVGVMANMGSRVKEGQAGSGVDVGAGGIFRRVETTACR